MRRLFSAFTLLLCALGLSALLCACGETAAESCNHSFGEAIVEAAPSCTESGRKVRTCTICGFEQSEEIPATGHSFGEIEVKTPATCNKEGEGVRTCSVCGTTESVALETTDHDYTARTEIIAQATCGKEGTQRHFCQCGAYEDTSIAATGEHDYAYSESESTPATCAEDGKRVEICKVCGDRKEDTLPHLEHNFGDEWVTVKPATPYGEGLRQKLCQNEGCTEAGETETLPRTQGTNAFSFNVGCYRTTGAALTGARGTKVVVKDIAGNVVDTSLNLDCSFRVYEGEYYVSLENLPKNYMQTKETYLADKDHTDIAIDVAISPVSVDGLTSLTQLKVGSALYDLELQVVELKKADDYTTTFSELLKTYKCIVLDIYGRTCTWCVHEIDEHVEFYKSQCSTGKTFGEEVAFLAVGDTGETVDTIRQFKSNPNAYYNGGAKERNLPWRMIYCPTLPRIITRGGGQPQIVYADCEGIITSIPDDGATPMYELVAQCEKNIQGWQARHDRQTAENAAETATAVDALVPVQNASKTIEKAPKLLPEKKKI